MNCIYLEGEGPFGCVLVGGVDGGQQGLHADVLRLVDFTVVVIIHPTIIVWITSMVGSDAGLAPSTPAGP